MTKNLRPSVFCPLAPTLGELSPKVTERVPGALFPSPSSLHSATSPTGRGKDRFYVSFRGSRRGGRPRQLIYPLLNPPVSFADSPL